MSFLVFASVTIHGISSLSCIAAIWIQAVSIYTGRKSNTFYNRVLLYVSFNFLIFHISIACYILLGILYYFGSKSVYEYIDGTSYLYQCAVLFAMTAGNLGPMVLCSLWKGVSNFSWLGLTLKKTLATLCQDENLIKLLYLMNTSQIGILLSFNIWFSDSKVQLINRISLIPIITTVVFLVFCIPALYDITRTVRYMQNQQRSSDKALLKAIQTHLITLAMMFLLVSSYVAFIIHSATEQIREEGFFNRQSKQDSPEMNVTASENVLTPIILGSCALGIFGSAAVLVNHFRSHGTAPSKRDKKKVSTNHFLNTINITTKAAKTDAFSRTIDEKYDG